RPPDSLPFAFPGGLTNDRGPATIHDTCLSAGTRAVPTAGRPGSRPLVRRWPGGGVGLLPRCRAKDPAPGALSASGDGPATSGWRGVAWVPDRLTSGASDLGGGATCPRPA